jgi:probable phosphoglycerate mutase
MSSGNGQLVLVRHGATEWSTVHKHTGRTDLPLTEDGRVEAVNAGERLAAKWQFTNVFASPLQRARTTAELAGFDNPVIDDDLMEWDYGEHDGRTTLEIRAERPGYSKWKERPPGGESVTDVGERVDRFLARLAGVEGDTVVFAHGHLLAILIARWLQLDATNGQQFPLETATLTVLGIRRDARVLYTFNA